MNNPVKSHMGIVSLLHFIGLNDPINCIFGISYKNNNYFLLVGKIQPLLFVEKKNESLFHNFSAIKEDILKLFVQALRF